MHKISLLRITAFLLIVGLSSCSKDPVTITNASCRLKTFTEYEGVDPTQPGSGTVYAERSFVYDHDKLIRIDIRKRGVADGYRSVTYSGDLPVAESFVDKNNSIVYDYKFNYEPGTKRLSSIDIVYNNVSPAIQARYTYHYDDKDRVDSVTNFFSGSKSGYIKYAYETNNGVEKITANLFQTSNSDPNFKLNYVRIEYTYDDKKSPSIWPIFTWDQYHGEQLDLITPKSNHNIRTYTYKSLNQSASDLANNVLVFDTIYPTTTAAIDYNEHGYVGLYTEHRMNSTSPVVTSYLYDCN